MPQPQITLHIQPDWLYIMFGEATPWVAVAVVMSRFAIGHAPSPRNMFEIALNGSIGRRRRIKIHETVCMVPIRCHDASRVAVAWWR